MHRPRFLLPTLCAAVVLFTTPRVMGFDVEPIVKFFFGQRPVTTVLNLGSLPDCCLDGEAEYRMELEDTLALIPDTRCSADNGLRDSDGDLLFTPFEFLIPGARPKNDDRTLVRFKNQGTFTLGVTTFNFAKPTPTQSCGGNTFFETSDADVDLNRKVNWVTPDTESCSSKNGFSLRSTALHELGHVVGLEHTNVEDALMFAFGEPCDFAKETFQKDDQDQFKFIYACEDANCLPGAAEPEPTEKKCNDGIDNDGDELIDCADSDCASRGFCKT